MQRSKVHRAQLNGTYRVSNNSYHFLFRRFFLLFGSPIAFHFSLSVLVNIKPKRRRRLHCDTKHAHISPGRWRGDLSHFSIVRLRRCKMSSEIIVVNWLETKIMPKRKTSAIFLLLLFGVKCAMLNELEESRNLFLKWINRWWCSVCCGGCWFIYSRTPGARPQKEKTFQKETKMSEEIKKISHVGVLRGDVNWLTLINYQKIDSP